MALVIYQTGGLIAGKVAFNFFTAAAAALIVCVLFLLFRKGCQPEEGRLDVRSAASTGVQMWRRFQIEKPLFYRAVLA